MLHSITSINKTLTGLTLGMLLAGGTAMATPQPNQLSSAINSEYLKSTRLATYAYPSNPILLAYSNTFVFNPRTHKWYAYGSNGRIIRSGRASGGAGYCRDVKRSCRTPVGHFRVLRKGGPGCKSSKYPLGRGGAPMSYCMFFSKYYAIHGSNHVPAANVSHGCIRVHPSAARWLSNNFMRHGTRVIVKSY